MRRIRGRHLSNALKLVAGSGSPYGGVMTHSRKLRFGHSRRVHKLIQKYKSEEPVYRRACDLKRLGHDYPLATTSKRWVNVTCPKCLEARK